MRDLSLVLDDILDAVERLVFLGAGRCASDLAEDRDLSEQVLYNLIVLGEAAKRVDAAIRSRFPDVDWQSMAATRDRLVHHYEGVDWEVVVLILDRDLPPLVARLREIRDVVRYESPQV